MHCIRLIENILTLRRISFLLLMMLLSSCATPYQYMGLRGGYTDEMLDANTAQVLFAGNAHTSLSAVKSYLLLRCAEVTLRHKFSYFEVVTTYSDSQHSVVNLPRPRQSRNGKSVYQDVDADIPLTLEPIYQNEKHSVSAVIVMYKRNGSTQRRYRYDARRLIANVANPGMPLSQAKASARK